MSRRPVVVLMALELEYQAVREKLAGPRLHRHPQGTRFEVGRFAGGRCRLVLAHVGKGNQSAAVLAERAIAEFSPAVVLFVGVAGALHPHIALGDVVVANQVYAYHGGTSQDDGLMSRPRAWPTSHAADQVARHLKMTASWTRHLSDSWRLPEVHFGPIAAGEVVLNSAVSGHARWIREHYNDALAIEMEGAGVAQAGHLNRALPVVVVRGISDRADGTKERTDQEQWQPRAAANAAAFAVALAEELSQEDREFVDPTTPQTSRRPTMHETTQNIAKGNAQVAVQAGTVHGGIRFTSAPETPVSLGEALADLRAAIHGAWTAGHLDEDTYTAVEEELETVDATLEADTPVDQRTLRIALKKVRGLIGDVADLAAKLATVIALTRMSS